MVHLMALLLLMSCHINEPGVSRVEDVGTLRRPHVFFQGGGRSASLCIGAWICSPVKMVRLSGFTTSDLLR